MKRLLAFWGTGICLMMCWTFSSCTDQSFGQGEILYNNFCSNCHAKDGTGLSGLIPPLAQADYLISHRKELPCIIRHGLKGPIEVNGRVYQQEMVGIPQLSEFEIANILNYIEHSWGNGGQYFTIQEVNASLEDCPK